MAREISARQKLNVAVPHSASHLLVALFWSTVPYRIIQRSGGARMLFRI